MNISKVELELFLELYNETTRLKNDAIRGTKKLVFEMGPSLPSGSPVVVVMGSFDPLTIAHHQYFNQGIEWATERHHKQSELLIVSSVHHVDKKVDYSKNASIEDRVLMLEDYSYTRGSVSIALANVALFRDLAPLVENAYQRGTPICFLTGADVMEKIVDLSYYPKGIQDLQNALNTLFAYHFIVAPRKVSYNMSTYPLRQPRLLTPEIIIDENPMLKQYKNQIHNLALSKSKRSDTGSNAGSDEGLGEGLDGGSDAGSDKGLDSNRLLEEVSATRIRELRGQGKSSRDLDAPGISHFLDNRHLYENNDVYTSFVAACHFSAEIGRRRSASVQSYSGGLHIFLKQLEADPVIRTQVIEVSKNPDNPMAREFEHRIFDLN